MDPTIDLWFLAYPGMQSLDLTGPFEVFHAANQIAEARRLTVPTYRPRIAGPETGLITDHMVTTHWWSSAGVTAGIDLALALVEADVGAEIAQEVARYLVVFLRRPGGQSQFSADLSVEALAGAVGLSPRHFSRLFSSETGQTPARYVEMVRVEAARRHLEDDSSGLEAVARLCGTRFSTVSG